MPTAELELQLRASHGTSGPPANWGAEFRLALLQLTGNFIERHVYQTDEGMPCETISFQNPSIIDYLDMVTQKQSDWLLPTSRAVCWPEQIHRVADHVAAFTPAAVQSILSIFLDSLVNGRVRAGGRVAYRGVAPGDLQYRWATQPLRSLDLAMLALRIKECGDIHGHSTIEGLCDSLIHPSFWSEYAYKEDDCRFAANALWRMVTVFGVPLVRVNSMRRACLNALKEAMEIDWPDLPSSLLESLVSPLCSTAQGLSIDDVEFMESAIDCAARGAYGVSGWGDGQMELDAIDRLGELLRRDFSVQHTELGQMIGMLEKAPRIDDEVSGYDASHYDSAADFDSSFASLRFRR